MLEACGYETLNIVQLNHISSPARWGYAFETAASARYTQSQMCHLSWVLDENRCLRPSARCILIILIVFFCIFEHPHRSPSASVVPEISAPRQFDSISAGGQQKNTNQPIESRDIVDEDRLGQKRRNEKKKTTSTDDNFGNQMCKFSEMIDVGIFGSYLIDSERKFMGFGSSNPHIALGFTQFVTVWYIYVWYRFKHAERCAMIKLKRPTLESMPAEVAERIFWLAIWTGLQWFAHAWITCWHHKLPHVSRARP